MFTFECDCSAVGAGDENEFHQDEWRTARREHRCCECHRTIEPGEYYERVTLRSEGEFSRFKTCLGCYRIRMRWMPGGWWYGCVAESIAECIGFNYVTGD